LNTGYGKAFAYISKKDMKQHTLLGLCLMVMVMTLSSCELVGDIFQAGLFVGILVVVIIIALVIWLISKFRR
jgi:cytosine/uracil/thiamine/allantoin permease